MEMLQLDQLRQLDEEGQRRFAGWDAPLFAAYCRSFLPALWNRLPPRSNETFAGLSALVQQGIGEGYLKSEPEAPPLNFLEFCLRGWLPQVLPGLPPEQHLPLLARVWNLGEGLLREPEWVSAYVMSRMDELRTDKMPEEFLIGVLRPILEPAPPARWEPPFQVTLISLRHDDDEFLPGEMHMAAPTVLVVSDRRRPTRLGVHLRRQGQSVVLGRFGPNNSFQDHPAGVQVAWQDDTVHIGKAKVALPFLGSPFRFAVVAAGYLVASAVDSQKLWIVESAA
jgi:hypothetical protein